MSPVWSRKAGLGESAAMRATAAVMVAAVSGLAGLLKPIWVSLIWTKVSPPVAAAASLSSKERGTPPLTVQSRPAPAQAMQFSRPRRSTPFTAVVSVVDPTVSLSGWVVATGNEDRGLASVIPKAGRKEFLWPAGNKSKDRRSNGMKDRQEGRWSSRRISRQVVLPHLDEAYSLARWLTGSAADAEDVVQDL